VNLDGSGPHPLRAVFKWAVVDRLLGRRRPAKRAFQTPAVPAQVDLLKHPPRAGEGVRLTWIGHASWLVQLDGVSLLIDPVFSRSLGPGTRRNVEPALLPETLPTIDAQLVTHNHRDHLDLPSLKAVRAPILGGLGLSDFFAREGLNCRELEWWQEERVGDVKVRFVPAQHWSQRGVSDTNETLWGGFVVEGSSARIYHTGDTAYFDGFREIGQRYGQLDAALLPIGAYDPAWFMSKQHLNPEEATQAFLDLGARHFLAMHWGTFQLTDEPLSEPPERLEAEWQRRGLNVERCHVLPIGASLELSSDVNVTPRRAEAPATR